MNKCQVCGKDAADNSLNCGEHAHIREKMALLAQDIYNLESSVGADIIKTLAVKHKCSEITVRNHLKRQGFRCIRKWTSEEKSPFVKTVCKRQKLDRDDIVDVTDFYKGKK